MTQWLRSQGYMVNHKRVERLMGVMGLQAICPKPKLSRKGYVRLRQVFIYRDWAITSRSTTLRDSTSLLSIEHLCRSMWTETDEQGESPGGGNHEMV